MHVQVRRTVGQVVLGGDAIVVRRLESICRVHAAVSVEVTEYRARLVVLELPRRGSNRGARLGRKVLNLEADRVRGARALPALVIDWRQVVHSEPANMNSAGRSRPIAAHICTSSGRSYSNSSDSRNSISAKPFCKSVAGIALIAASTVAAVTPLMSSACSA